MAETTKPLRAVVFGGTGAVGRELVSQLVASPRWAAVTTIGRRPLDPPPADPSNKLTQITTNMDTLESDPKVKSALSSGVDTVFCALGTTRSAAGSADAFRKVDLDYVSAAARAAKAANVPQFSLVSAQGASPNIWSSDLLPFHGLLYSKCKGLAEEAVKAQGFQRATLLRPGLLQRGEMVRPAEKIFAKVMGGIPTSKVAAFMLRDAEDFHSGRAADNVKIASMSEMQKFVVA